MKWREIYSIGTKKSNYGSGIGNDYQFIDFTFINETTGFLSGNFSDYKVIKEKKLNRAASKKIMDAIILKSTDSGNLWEEHILGKGEIWDINYVENTLIALRQSFYGDQAEKINAHIHVSDDKGITWKEVGLTHYNVRKIKFWTKKNGLAYAEEVPFYESKECILLTKDGGKNWEEITIKIPKKSGEFEMDSKGNLYYITYGNNRYAILNLNTMEVTHLNLPRNIEEPFAIAIDNNDVPYFITENKGKRIVMYKRTSDDDYKAIKFPEDDMLINDVHIFDSSISVFSTNKESTFPKIHFHHSDNMGETWKEEKLPTDYKASPVAFLGKDKIWAWALAERLLVRE